MSSSSQHALLGRLADSQNLSQSETAEAVDGIMQGLWTEGEIGLFLTGLRDKGETAEELAGAAGAMRRHMRQIKTSRTGIIDTCGTGGVGSTIFNVSTTAAIVTAAAGVPVAKHGNRRVTSRSGSADVLTELGVNVQADIHVVERSLEELGICFCFAPLMHSAMKHVAPVRQKLGFRTIFNLLGPLTNPAGAEFQLLGVGRSELRPLLADALLLLKARRAVVVSGDDGLGEVTIAGRSYVTEVETLADAKPIPDAGGFFIPDGTKVEYFWSPGDFDVEPGVVEKASVESPADSAAIIRKVLAGEKGVPRDLVVVNAAAALWTAGRAPDTLAAAKLAREAIDSGAAEQLLAKLVAVTNAA